MKGGIFMCDVNKYKKMYDEFKELDLDDTLELVMESDDQDEQDFFEMVSDFFLQRRQREVIKEGRF